MNKSLGTMKNLGYNKENHCCTNRYFPGGGFLLLYHTQSTAGIVSLLTSGCNSTTSDTMQDITSVQAQKKLGT